MLLALPTALFTAWPLVLTTVAAFTDTRRGIIPNWLTLPTLLLAPLAQLALRGASGGVAALWGAFACGLVPAAMFGLRAIGGGDVKLFAALGALCGASQGLELQLTSYVLAAIGASCAAVRAGALRATLLRAARVLIPGRVRAEPSPAAPDPLTPVRLGVYVLSATLLLCARTWLGTP